MSLQLTNTFLAKKMDTCLYPFTTNNKPDQNTLQKSIPYSHLHSNFSANFISLSQLLNTASFESYIQKYIQSCDKENTLNEATINTSNDLQASYALTLSNTKSLPISQYLGEPIALAFNDVIFCSHCGKVTPKSYSQGYCYPCFKKLPNCDLCMMNPHTCHYHLGTCRDDVWAEKVCFKPHIVYLSHTSAFKVGITKLSQLPTRWIDQGATHAIPIIMTSSRRLAGIFENIIAKHLADKTNWRTMLKMAFTQTNKALLNEEILALRKKVIATLPKHIDMINLPFLRSDEFYILNEKPIIISYPMLPEFISSNQDFSKIPIKSYNLLKQHVDEKLIGIKGQYLIFEGGVLNIRKYTSHELIINY